MATEFLRLYRELTKQDIDALVPDLNFDKERRSVMKALGYRVGNSPERVRASKHHGKTARLRMEETRTKSLSGEILQRERNLRERQRELDKSNELNSELQGLLLKNKHIPKKLWVKAYGNADTEPNIFEDMKTSQLIRSATVPRKPNACVFDSDHGKIRKGAGGFELHKSRNHWTPDEIERLNNVYWELELPPSFRNKKSQSKQQKKNNMNQSLPPIFKGGKCNTVTHISAKQAAWDNYYRTFAKRFQLYFPHRNLREITAKVEELLSTNRFKQPGETEYWKTTKQC